MSFLPGNVDWLIAVMHQTMMVLTEKYYIDTCKCNCQNKLKHITFCEKLTEKLAETTKYCNLCNCMKCSNDTKKNITFIVHIHSYNTEVKSHNCQNLVNNTTKANQKYQMEAIWLHTMAV